MYVKETQMLLSKSSLFDLSKSDLEKQLSFFKMKSSS